MKRSAAIAASLIIASASLMSGCSGKNSGKGSSSEESSRAQLKLEYGHTADPNAVPDSGASPTFELSNSHAMPGEIAEVTVSIIGAEKLWQACGIHFAYPMELEAQMSMGDTAKFEQGPASEYMAAFTAAIWTDNRTEKMVAENLYSLFFAAVGAGDVGSTGEVATFYFKVPDDAQLGTVYPLTFFEIDGDKFSDSNMDPKLQAYAFSHWKDGSITVG